MKLRATNLPDTDFGPFNKSDPIYEVYKAGSNFQMIHRSNIVEHNLNPIWKSSILDLAELCAGQLDAPFTIIISDKNKGNREGYYEDKDYLGTIQTSVNQLLTAQPSDPIQVQKAPKRAERRAPARLIFS